MPRILVITAVLGVALLSLPVLYLVTTNYSWRVIQPVLSVLGAAVITLFITLAVTLKEIKWSESLYATLITDSEGRPIDDALIADADVNVGLRLSEFYSLAAQALKNRKEMTLDTSERSILHKQILQTSIMETLSGHYSGGWAFTFQRPKVLGGFHPGSVGQEIATDAASSSIDAETLWAELEAKNPVAKTRLIGFGKEGLMVPESTLLTIHELQPHVGLLEPSPMFDFEKKHFFKITIMIAKGFSQSGNPLPFKIRSPETQPTTELITETYLVTVRARFLAERAGHPSMESYQQWGRGLVDVLRFTVTD
jgi:hypothetical protein